MLKHGFVVTSFVGIECSQYEKRHLSRRLRFGDYVERRKRIFVAIYHAAASIDWLC